MDFRSRSEFLAHSGRLLAPAWEEIPVGEPAMTLGGFVERWYREAATGAVWRLIEPAAPLRGLWERFR